MQLFTRELIRTHCVGHEWPEMLGRVALGETFIMQTEPLNAVNGPIFIDGDSRR